MTIRNNVTRLLDSRKIPYEVHELPKEKLGASETAKLMNVSSELVYKSIVVKRKIKGKPILAIIPGNKEVNLKKLAKALGEKKLIMPTQKEAENITGLKAGGISPLALLHRGFQFVIDSTVQTQRRIYISGGQRGLNILLQSSDLIYLINPKIAEISKNNPMQDYCYANKNN